MVLLLLHYEFLSSIQFYPQTYQNGYNINSPFHKSETELHTSQKFLISQNCVNMECIGWRTFRKKVIMTLERHFQNLSDLDWLHCTSCISVKYKFCFQRVSVVTTPTGQTDLETRDSDSHVQVIYTLP